MPRRFAVHFVARVNVHHLELFYYVAKHGGISAAVRHIPYGVQQPAVSGQIGQLEKDLGVRLFERQPFRLTPAGEQLQAFVAPFFGGLGAMRVELAEQAAPRLRVGAAEAALRQHLPEVFSRVQQAHPGMRLVLRSGYDTELVTALEQGEVDVVVVPIVGGKLPRCALPLLRLPLALLVPQAWKMKSAAELWTQRRIDRPLIGLPARDGVTSAFQAELKRRGIAWPVTIEASSIELVTDYVAAGRGAGISVMFSDLHRRRGVRVLELSDFRPLLIAARWQGQRSPLINSFLEEVRDYAREAWPANVP